MAIEDETDAGPVNIGELFQGYQIVKLLGQGGYASVYHARREFIGRDVAIKISNRAVTREVFKRFQSEARFTHRLDHPNIVKVEDAAVATSGHLYIVMELLRGQTFWDARRQYGADPISRTRAGASKLPESGTWQSTESSTQKSSSETRSV